MAKRKHPPSAPRRKKAKESLSIGLIFVGFVLGVLVSVSGYYVLLAPEKDPPLASADATRNNKDDARDDYLNLTFEYDSILPEIEVVIPNKFVETLRSVLPQDQGVEEAPDAPTEAKQNAETYYIQAGSFRERNDAERMRAQLLLLNLDAAIQAATINNTQYYRVRIGPLLDYPSFDKSRARLEKNNIQYIVLKSNQ